MIEESATKVEEGRVEEAGVGEVVLGRVLLLEECSMSSRGRGGGTASDEEQVTRGDGREEGLCRQEVSIAGGREVERIGAHEVRWRV